MEIPTFGQIFKKLKNNDDLNSLELFLSVYMPLDDEERFRKMLREAIFESIINLH